MEKTVVRMNCLACTKHLSEEKKQTNIRKVAEMSAQKLMYKKFLKSHFMMATLHKSIIKFSSNLE